GFRVVRFDNRDIGHSTKIESAGVPKRTDMLLGRRRTAPYLLRDMAEDATVLMDHLGIESSHVVGVSMGGMIAQTVAIRHTARAIRDARLPIVEGMGHDLPRKLWPEFVEEISATAQRFGPPSPSLATSAPRGG